MRRAKGFSLIELLIVVAIILIIAAIAAPSFLHARMAANESAAVGEVRTLNTAQLSYNSTYPTVGFAGTLSYLAGTTCASVAPTSSTACLIDSALGNGTKSGYVFTLSGVSGTPAGTYQFVATPMARSLRNSRAEGGGRFRKLSGIEPGVNWRGPQGLNSLLKDSVCGAQPLKGHLNSTHLRNS
jgi:prepilin-type N-terminal cleavage/methylation domain-containing protein